MHNMALQISHLQAQLERAGKVKNPKPDFIRAVADCYSSMEKHFEAAASLEKVPDPKAKAGSP